MLSVLFIQRRELVENAGLLLLQLSPLRFEYALGGDVGRRCSPVQTARVSVTHALAWGIPAPRMEKWSGRSSQQVIPTAEMTAPAPAPPTLAVFLPSTF